MPKPGLRGRGEIAVLVDRVPSPTAGLSGLAIRGIEVIPVLAPLAREYRGSHYRMTNRATVLATVVTEQGIIGEAYVGDEEKSLHEICAVVRDEIAPRLAGVDAFAVERCWELAYPATFDILRDRRVGLVALAAVDTAIWDAVGKACGQPLWRLWGGYRASVPMIAIGGYYGAPPEAIDDEVGEYRAMGLAGMKFKVGGLSPAEDAARVRRARVAAGDDFVIAIDANQGYSVPEAIELARRVADLDIRWFEEPVRWHNDRRSLRDVRYATTVPVCAGQSELSPAGCRDLMEIGAIDVCNFDASWSGGPTAWRRTAALAHTYDVAMAHHEEPHVASHLIASQSHGTYVECFHPDRDPFWWNLVANRPPLRDGQLTMSDAPGLGWELDRGYLARYRLDR
jgi:D-galactarolactone cycloisomerase